MRVLKFIIQSTAPYRWYIFGLVIAVCFITIDNTLKPVLVKQLINTVSGKQESNLWMICFYYAVLQFMLIGSWTFSDYCLTSYTSRYRVEIAEHFMKNLYDYPYEFFQNNLSGSLTSKLNDAFQYLPHIIFTIVDRYIYFTLLVSISIILMFSVAPIFAAILSLWLIVFLTITFRTLQKSIVLNKSYAEEKSKVIGLFADYISNIFSVKTFTARNQELERFNNLKIPFVNIAQKGGFYHTKLYCFLGILTSFYALGFIIFLILGYKNGNLNPGDFALVVMLNFTIISNLYSVSHSLRDFVVDWSAVDHALALLEDTPKHVDKKDAKSLQVTEGRIRFDSVQFHYTNTESLFQNKNIVIEPGQKIGLVGYSGGGKTTFVHLILRLFEIMDGKILIDDQNICDLTQDSLRNAIALIPQDPSLFHRTLMENIRFSNEQATDEEVIQASKKAHAHEFITKLPQGYNSLVGERGVKLSGGQRQRIAIARAFLKNAPILILDEATSQLDSITEGLIQESLWELMQGKTSIVIAHRLSTLLHMDRILVFDQGKIVQDGTHSALLEQPGLYKTLWDAQIGGFLPDKKNDNENSNNLDELIKNE